MATFKHYSRKRRLIRQNKKTKWAPLWTVLKKYGKGKKKHPSEYSHKRSWRRTKLKI